MNTVQPSGQRCPFRFLDLPAEIRLKIETELLVRPEPVGWESTSFRKVTGWLSPPSLYTKGEKTWHVNPRILRVCKKIYEEGRDILYGQNIFGVEISEQGATFLGLLRIDDLHVQVTLQAIRNFDIVVKLQDYQEYEQTRNVVGTVSKILSTSPRLNSLKITIKFPALPSESASELVETGSESEALETEPDSESSQSESGSESLDRREPSQILWPFACLLRNVQRVTINGIRSRDAKDLQEAMRGDKPPHQLDQQYSIYKEIVLGGVAADLGALDESRQRWDSEGFSIHLKKSVQRVPEYLRSTLRIWSCCSCKSDDTIDILKSLRTAWVEEIAIPGPRKRARSL